MSKKGDALSIRMKENYENRYRFLLPRRTYTMIRIDGRAFHTYTAGLKEPFDDGLFDDMDKTAKELCAEIQGAKFAYVQSDEISILLTDFDEITTEAWFDNNLQKIVSNSASIATAAFNLCRIKRFVSENSNIQLTRESFNFKQAKFDSRAFPIPDRAEVFNYFLSRQRDATKNSISSVAQSLYSTSELENKHGDLQQEMIFQKGINWNDYSPKYKRGRIILKETYLKEETERSRWVMVEPPIFSEDKEFLLNLIPINNNNL